MSRDYKQILDFWFAPEMEQYWFNANSKIDKNITDRFYSVWQDAKDGKLYSWQDSALGSVALAIVLDQFPLNMFRSLPKSFSTEQQAVDVTLNAVAKNLANELDEKQKMFLFMPLMHSENMEHQNLSVRLAKENNLFNLEFAKHHRAIVAKFGRFPHRNKILNRQNSQAELQYLASDEAFLG